MENNILGMGRTISSQRAHQKTWKEECRARLKQELSCTCLPETKQSKADPQNTKGWRPAISTQTFFDRLEGQAQGIWGLFQTVENKPLFFWAVSHGSHQYQRSGKGSTLVLSLSRSMTRQEAVDKDQLQLLLAMIHWPEAKVGFCCSTS